MLGDADYLLHGVSTKLGQAYPKLGAAEGLSVREDPDIFRGQHSDPMRIQTGYEPPAKEPSEQDCLNYLRAYLQTMRTTPGGLGHTFIELQRHFPLPKDTLEHEPG